MNPNDAMYWVSNHKKYGLKSFDLLGVSYYPQWQDYTPADNLESLPLASTLHMEFDFL